MSEDSWRRMTAALGPLADRIAGLSLDPADPGIAAQVKWQLLTGIAQYIVDYRGQDAVHPQFMPFGNDVLNFNSVPDYMIRLAQIDGAGRYRISGTRGTSRFVEIQQMTGLDPVNPAGGPVLSRFALDDLAIASDGRFSLLLSPDQPADHDGDWIRLEPGATTLLLREAAYDWAREADSRMAIVRLDPPMSPPQVTAEAIDQFLDRLPAWVERRVAQWVAYVAQMRDAGQVNRLDPVTFTGGIGAQAYYEAVYALGPDEALMLDTAVPETCRYWGLLVTNAAYMTVDWARHRSSINGGQAHLDSDGRFRAVIGPDDPGVVNWADTGGNRQGIIQFRWNGASSHPLPRLTLVKRADLAHLLPPDTPKADGARRRRELEARRAGAQMRRRW
jgi:hypothetical protein